jgi:hypothetical protein
MEAKRLKGELGNESRRLTAKTAAASGRLTDHQVEACSPILNIEICQCAAANEMFCRANTFVEGEGEHLGGGEAIANQAFHLVASERLVAVTGESHELRVGIPALECREGLDGVRPQRDALAHEDRLMSADCTLALRSDHAITVYDRLNA